MAPQTITATNSTELADAFERLAAGEGGTIRLEASARPYDVRLADRGRPETDAPITITSDDPARPATIAQMTLVGRENVTIEGVVFDSRDGKRDGKHRDLELNHVRDVTVRDVEFRDGATETKVGPGQERGINAIIVRNSDDVEMSDLLIEGFFHGAAFFDSNDVVLRDSEITGLQGDAIRIAGMQDMLVENNHLHSMLGTSQNVNHSDMIQFWGTNIKQNTERVTIRENVLNTADGPSYQMIFGGNEDKRENGFVFEDITVERNVLYGAHHNMIVLGDTKRTVVRDNTVLFNSDTRQILEGGGDGGQANGAISIPGGRGEVIEGNLATWIRTGKAGENGFVRYADPSHPDHHENNFVNLAAGGSAELQSLRLLPGSQWDRKMGSPLTWSNAPVDELTAIARPEVSGDDLSLVRFDASHSRAPGGRLGENGAQYIWSFDDGTVKRGAEVTHDFGTVGERGYALEVRAGGRSDVIERKIAIEEPLLLSLETKGGRVRDASSYASRLDVDGGRGGGEGFVLDGSSQITVSRGSSQIYSLDSFSLSMTFAPAKAGTAGPLFALPESMRGRINSDGTFKVVLSTTEGRFEVETGPGAIEGTKPHDLGVVYDGGEIRLYVDGREEGSATASGLTKPLEHWGLTIGHPWNTSAKGVVSEFKLTAEVGGDGAPPQLKGEGGGAGQGGGGGGRPVVEGPDGGPDQGGGSGGGDEGPGGGSDGGSKGGSGAVVRLDFEGGVRDRAGEPAALQWDRGAVEFGPGSDGGRALELDGRDGAVTIARSNAEIFDLDAFEIAFDLRAIGTGSDGGRVLTLHRTLELALADDGALALELATDGGRAVARTEGGAIGTGWHAVEIDYASGEGVSISVDGEVLADAPLEGSTAEALWWGLVLGHPWGGRTADARLDDLVIRTGEGSGDPGSAGGSSGGGSKLVSGEGSGGGAPETLVSLDFEGHLRDPDGAAVRGLGPVGFGGGSEGRGARLGEGSVLVARENDFLHERSSFGIEFDLKRAGPGSDGRVIHFERALDAWVSDEGALTVALRTDEGRFSVSTGEGALSARGWHDVAIGYDDAAESLRVSVDGEAVETSASGETAPRLHWGLVLGSAWGDTLEAQIDAFRMTDTPDWA